MKIIKDGNAAKIALKELGDKTNEYKCTFCGCIFELTDDEVYKDANYGYEVIYKRCPQCSSTAKRGDLR